MSTPYLSFKLALSSTIALSLGNANAIKQAMYAQCDVDGNEYLLLDSFVDVQKDHTAISLGEQKFIHNGRE